MASGSAHQSSATSRIFFLLSFSLGLLWLGSRLVDAQAIRIPSRETTGATVFRQPERPVTQRLVRAEKAISDQNYDLAAQALGELLDESYVAEFPDQLIAQDYFVQGPGEEEAVSLRSRAEAMIAGMPAEGRERYEQLFGTRARVKLKDAVEERDYVAVAEVARKYLHTQAGYEAAVLLGRYHFDRGRPLAAVRWLSKVAQQADAASRFEPQLTLMIAAAWYYAGRNDRVQEVLLRLKERSADDAITIGRRKVELFDNDRETVKWLENLVGQRPRLPTIAEPAWTMFRGNARRNATTGGAEPMLRYRWRVPAVNDPREELLVREFQKEYRSGGVPAVVALHPLAVGDTILMRTPRRLIAVDVRTGRRTWYYPWFQEEDESQIQRFGPNPHVVNTNSLAGQQTHQRMWEDSAYGQLSSDGRRVFVLDDLSYALNSYSRSTIILPGGFRKPNRFFPKTYNRLVALDLRKQGKLSWIVGGQNGEGEPKLAGAFFLGPPLPHEGKLYALAEVRAEIRLVVLDAKTGRQLWSQQIANVDTQTIVIDSMRRLAGATPSLANGILVCPTSAGAAVAIDITARRLLWPFEYEAKSGNSRRPRVFGSVTYPNPARPVGQRWCDSSVTIEGSRVILTPVESDMMVCVDLYSGQKIWERPRGSDLYVACVHDGKVIVVGKNQLTAVRLEDGGEAFTSAAFGRSKTTPTGRGFYNGTEYYVPTSDQEVVKINLDSGKITGRTKTDQPLGNLVSYKDHLISQSSQHLTLFPQLKSLRQRVEQRLKDDPEDVWALTSKGRLLLHDGKRAEAVTVLEKAYALANGTVTSKSEIRSLLLEVLLAQLDSNFENYESLSKKIDKLIGEKGFYEIRLRYLRRLARGLTKRGKRREALATYLRIMAIDDAKSGDDVIARSDDELEAIEPHLMARRDRWVQAQMLSLLSGAEAEEREAMQMPIRERIQAAINAGSIKRLRRVIQHFGALPEADTARLSLAKLLIDAREWLKAEIILSRLERSEDRPTAAQATLLIAVLLEKASRPREAAAYYGRLADRFGDVACRNGQTGRQIVAELDPQSAVAQALAQGAAWPAGRVQATRVETRAASSSRIYPSAIRESKGPTPPGMQVHIDPSRGMTLVVSNAAGRVLSRTDVPRRSGHSYYSTTYRLAHGRANGHLLLMSLGYELVAVNTLDSSGASDPILWRKSLLPSIPGRSSSRTRTYPSSRVVTSPWQPPRYIAADKSGRPLGRMGPLNDHGVCYLAQEEIICVDPLSGQQIWTRSGIGAGAELFGDDELIFVVPQGQTRALVLRAADGHLLGQREVPKDSLRWTTVGRRVLTWSDMGAKRQLMMVDPWKQETVWTHDCSTAAKGYVLDDRLVGVLDPNGSFAVIELATGKKLVQQKLEPFENLAAAYLMQRGDQLLLITSKNASSSVSDATGTYQPVPTGHHTAMIDGRVYAFDATTGEATWPAPARVRYFGLPLDQPADSPVLLFLRQIRPRTRRGNSSTYTEVLCLDRRSGQAVFEKDDLPYATARYDLETSVEDKTLTLQLQRDTFRLKFTELPQPPAPPYQAVSLESGSMPANVGRAVPPGFEVSPPRATQRGGAVVVEKLRRLMKEAEHRKQPRVFQPPADKVPNPDAVPRGKR